LNLRGVFVTGTGTGVGKTVVSAGLLTSLRDSGISALPVKPVQTGCSGGTLSASDLGFSLRMAGLRPEANLMNLMCQFRYRQACSPHLAGRLDGRIMNIESVKGAMTILQKGCDCMVAEGAGGIMVPINSSEMMIDLMVDLGWPIVLVARGDLGTINHTLLSLDVLNRAGLRTVAVVVNHLDEDNSIAARYNADSISEFGGVPLVAEIPHMQDVNEAMSDPVFVDAITVLRLSIMEYI
jgi:dethiobiotin synthetase